MRVKTREIHVSGYVIYIDCDGRCIASNVT